MNETATLANEVLKTLFTVDKNHDCVTSKIRAKLINSFEGDEEEALNKYSEFKILKACELLEEEECIKRTNTNLDFIGISFKGEEVVRKGGFINYLQKHSKFSIFFSDSNDNNNENDITQKELLKVIKELIFSNSKLKSDLEFKEDEAVYQESMIKDYDIDSLSSIKIEVPDELKLSFQQYILFFKEYIHKTKGESIYFEVVKINEGLRVDIKPDEVHDFKTFRKWFNEYFDLMRKGGEKINIEFENQLSDDDATFFLAELKNQVDFTKKQIEIIELKTKQRKTYKSIETVRLFLPASKERLIERGYKDIYHFKQNIKTCIAKGESSKGLEILLQYLEEIKSPKHDEAILLNSRFNILENERRTGVLNREDWALERVKIEKSILDFINSALR